MQQLAEWVRGIRLRSNTTDITDNLEGSIWLNSTTNRFRMFVNNAIREFADLDQAQTFTNKTLTSPVISNPVITGLDIDDDQLLISGSVDDTKKIAFDSDSLITTGNTRTLQVPDSDGEIVLKDLAQTMTNKIISGSHADFDEIVIGEADDSATGPNATLTTVINSSIRLTNGSLVSIDMIPGGEGGQLLLLTNATGVAITMNNDTGGTAGDRVLTGTGVSLSLADEASLILKYDGTESRWMVIGGSGSGSSIANNVALNLFNNGDAENVDDTSAWSSGNNILFDAGGTLAGTFSRSTTAADLITDTAVYKLVGSSTAIDNDDDYVISEEIAIDQGLRGRTLRLGGQYKFDGISGNIAIRIKDSTNGDILTLDSQTLDTYDDSTDDTAAPFDLFFHCPSDCANIEVGFQVLTGEISKTLIWDDLVVTPNIQSVNQVSLAEPMKADDGGVAITGLTGSSTANVLVFTSTDFDDDNLYGTGTGFYTVPSTGKYLVCGGIHHNEDPDGASEGDNAQLSCYIGTVGTPASDTKTLTDQWEWNFDVSGDNNDGSPNCKIAGVVSATIGDKIYLVEEHTSSTSQSLQTGAHYNYFTVSQVSGDTVEHYLAYDAKTSVHSEVRVDSANGFGSTNITIRRFDTLTTDVGSAITYVDSAADGASFTINEAGIYHITYSDTSLAASYHSVTVNSTELTTAPQSLTDPTERIFMFRLSVANYPSSSGASVELQIGDIVRCQTSATGDSATDDFTHFIISKQAAGTLLGVPVPLVGYVKDVKAAATSSGGLTSATWNVRDLTESQGQFTQFGSLSANTFTLNPGTYDIEWSAPAYVVDNHQTKLRNTTDSTDDGIGSAGYSDGVGGTSSTSNSIGSAQVTITSPKAFQIQHNVVTTNGSDGGGANGNFAVSEIYTQVKITKRV